MNRTLTILTALSSMLTVTGTALALEKLDIPGKESLLSESPKVLGISDYQGVKSSACRILELKIQCRSGNILNAFLVLPEKEGKYPGIYFMHWLGEIRNNNTEFLKEAEKLAGKGIVSLLPQGFFPWTRAQKGVPEDLNLIRDQVSDMTEALAFFISHSEVDKSRLLFIGHDYGAMHGMLMGSFTKAFKGYVIMAAVSSYLDWGSYFYKISDPEKEKDYNAVIRPADPGLFIGDLSPVLFQFAERDEYIKKEQALDLMNHASGTNTVRWYNTNHSLESQAAENDRAEWISAVLNIPVN